MVAANETAPAEAVTAPSPGWAAVWSAIHTLRRVGQTLAGQATGLLPTGLYARALLIIITPIVLLEGVVAFSFMERHWQAVTGRLSEATARNIAALIDVYEDYPRHDNYARLLEMARERLGLSMTVLPPGDLPVPQPKPFFALLDRTLSRELGKQIDRPFWIDTVGQSDHVEIRVKHDKAVLRFVARRSQTYASNSHIFLMWMVGTSVVLLTVSILFLRNQIRPILRLAEAADAFGKGRQVGDDFRPRGAREVRQASQAFLEMRERITQHVDQRTTMLAGVSHDLRTVLTRLRLQLAFLGDGPEVAAMRGDLTEMQSMLEDYLAFAKGDGGEVAAQTHVRTLLEEIVSEALHLGVPMTLRIRRRRRDLVTPLKRNAMKRAIANLVSNAARYGDHIVIRAATEREWLRIEVDDDGPGIPETERENVFRPFYRLEQARTQEEGNSGLGLAIARDIAKSHGGDVTLGESSMGGLRAIIRVPL
jgi:two-component system osmolarity sensor histidine kinase EnvZ